MIQVLFEDEYLCVVNKPHGYVVHKTRGAEQFPALLQELRDQLQKRIYPVHRLDRGTSGCLSFAFSSKAARLLQEKLQSEDSVKKYTALCLGHLDKEGLFDRCLSNEKKIKQDAKTEYKVIQEFEKYSLLELRIHTGRRHQIRRHLSHEGHHIIGDVNHGKGWLNRRFREEFNFHRLFLHCHQLSFSHPFSEEYLDLHCDLEPHLVKLLPQLEAKASKA